MDAGTIRTMVALGVAAGVLAAGFVVSHRAVSAETARAMAAAQRAYELARSR